MKRLICLHDDMNFIGGGERVLFRVAAIARRWARTDLALLWSKNAPGAELLEGFDRVETFAFPAGLRLHHAPALVGAMRRLRTWLRSEPAALMAFSLRAALHTAPLARWLDLPLGWMCQQSFPLFESRFGKGKQRVALGALALARTQVVCASDEGWRALREADVPAARLHRIRNGIDFEHYAAAAMSGEEKRRWRAAHGIPDAELVAVCVARLDPFKNHPLALRALRSAASDGVRVALVCIGDGSARGEGRYPEQLRRMASDLGVADRVVWAGDQEDVRPWLGMADVALLSSRKECASLALAEAGASGLPLVASRVGGNPDIVRHGETGLLFDPGDDAGCAAALCQLARDPARRVEMGARACSLVRAEFNAEQWDEEWSRFTRQLLGESPRA